MHENIERAMRSAVSIDNFDEFVRIVQRSREQLHVEKQEIFREWKSKKRINTNRQKVMEDANTQKLGIAPNVLLQDIVEVKFVKGKRELFYKTSFESDQYEEFDFLQKKVCFTPTTPSYKMYLSRYKYSEISYYNQGPITKNEKHQSSCVLAKSS
ncbi:unnamed protein product [Brassicogethes aeneus]|uniref:Uncharacterized protein n=1 Tax=Brassicogethes aeneus TaxID=1431903 RepID=A0A9P0BD47_BRAAE|nr:unnamed protein product [Brassicogethes aeneus]